ncbi:prephenate dehydrogenase [Rhodococcus sp. HNM0569]|uniref:prephenate dehydrogenase n=1 Tax=Rhodococcus sp. HNM0569 TaxID=2716340 RepID=UPI00146E2050|nr:prephenate dehydrogenase [Rhodococcus sp. HNM0569]NLU83535.1 prephenate dehydrogenase [Rhodococcus sp. HNM0569]
MCQPEAVSNPRSVASTTPPVCVLGLGLIGGSLLRAAVRAGRKGWGYNRSDATAAAAREDGFDASTDLRAVLGRAEAESALIVIAVPMPAVDATLDAIAEYAPSCPITDVVSVKAAVLEAVSAHGMSPKYVGGHPMAGTSASGWTVGSVNLFREAVWVVDTRHDVDPHIWRQVAQLALDCGAVVVPAEPVEHDSVVARISHLPHLLAETLAVTGDAGGPLALGLAAGSFRDGTRVAGSSPTLVRAMCEGNRDALLVALDEALALLTATRASLDAEASVADLVDAGHAARGRYDEQTHWEIVGIEPGSDDWAKRLQDAGRRGGRIRRL